MLLMRFKEKLIINLVFLIGTYLFIFLIGFLAMGKVNATPTANNAYDFSFQTLRGSKELSLSEFKGKVLLVVNTASHCGFTKQYAGLEQLYKRYKDQGLVILGVPSNDFGKQEPGDAQEIAQFCQINYGVTFPMTTKQIVSGSMRILFIFGQKSNLVLAQLQNGIFINILLAVMVSQ